MRRCFQAGNPAHADAWRDLSREIRKIRTFIGGSSLDYQGTAEVQFSSCLVQVCTPHSFTAEEVWKKRALSEPQCCLPTS